MKIFTKYVPHLVILMLMVDLLITYRSPSVEFGNYVAITITCAIGWLGIIALESQIYWREHYVTHLKEQLALSDEDCRQLRLLNNELTALIADKVELH